MTGMKANLVKPVTTVTDRKIRRHHSVARAGQWEYKRI